MGEGKEAKKIIVEYSDGTLKESDKGIVVKFEPSEVDSDEQKFTLLMVDVSGEEFQDFILAVIELASEMLDRSREVEE